MLKATFAIASIGFLIASLSPSATGQTPPAQTAPAAPIQNSNDPGYGGGRNSYAGPSLIVYSPRETVDRRIDQYMADWHESLPRSTHGSLVLRDMLTRGDYFAPPQRGAVLPAENFVAHGTLAAHASTTPARLDKQQEVFYFIGGTGTLTAGGATAEVRKDIAVFIPANLEFVMTNTGDQPLTMYVINEPTFTGFHPIDKMLAIDEHMSHVRTPAGKDPYIVPPISDEFGSALRCERDKASPRLKLASISNLLGRTRGKSVIATIAKAITNRASRYIKELEDLLSHYVESSWFPFRNVWSVRSVDNLAVTAVPASSRQVAGVMREINNRAANEARPAARH